MRDSIAFIYVHAFNGTIRVESLDTAKHIDGQCSLYFREYSPSEGQRAEPNH